jgi:hypothetical protein
MSGLHVGPACRACMSGLHARAVRGQADRRYRLEPAEGFSDHPLFVLQFRRGRN